MTIRLLCSATLALCASVLPLAAQLPDTQVREIDHLFATWNSDTLPGCVAGVMRDGRLVFGRGYGVADLSSRVRLAPDTRVGIASLSKPFTAAAIALLVHEGRLDPDADIRTILPEMRDYGTPIRVRDLVHQTSGLRDYISMTGLRGDDAEGALDHGAILRMIARQRETNHEPGSAWAYSNTNYWLLAEIVQRVSGMTLRDYAEEHLFAPLGMHATTYALPGEPLPMLAESYRLSGDRLVEARMSGEIAGDGGMYTTMEDLARWDAHYVRPTLSSDPAGYVRQITENGMTRQGTPTGYGWGNQFSSYRGLDTQGHGGTWGGFRVQYLRFPSERVSVAALCNQLEISPYQLVRRMADIVLHDRLDGTADPDAAPPVTPSPPPVESQPVDRAVASTLVGRYWSHDLETHYEIVRDGDLLRLRDARRNASVIRVQHDTLIAPARRMIVQRNAEGIATGFTMHSGRVRNVAFERVDGVPPVVRIPHGAAAVIDGEAGEGEWEDASEQVVEVAPDWSVRVRLKHDGEHLFAAFFDLRDGVVRVPEVLIDAHHDRANVWRDDDWWFHASAQDCASQGRYNDYTTCRPDATDWSATNIRGMDFPAVMELRIPLATIGVAPGATIGLALNVTDTQRAWNFWPARAQMAVPGSWAEAVLQAR